MIDELHYRLQLLEPVGLKSASVPLRFVLYVILVRIVIEVAFDAFRGLVRAFHVVVCATLNFLAPKLPPDFTEPLAWFFVKFEATMFRTRLLRSRKPRLLALPRRRNLTAHAKPGPQIFTRLSNAIRFSTIAPLMLAALLLILPFMLAWKLVQPRVSSLISLLITLWYLGLLREPFELMNGIKLGNIQLSVVLAAGALIAVMYTIANSDVRGRAELNKTASLTCRLALHGCTYPLLMSSNALREIRIYCTRKLQKFPRRHEIKRVARRPDLEWRGRLLLPRGSSPILPRWRTSRLLKSRLIRKFITEWVYSRQYLRQPGDRLAKRVEFATCYGMIEDACSAIVEQISELRKTGMVGKIDRALDSSGIEILVTVQDVNFGKNDANALLAAGESSWLDSIVSENDKKGVRSSWEALSKVPPDDPQLRRACVDLTRKLRIFVRSENRKYWRAAVTEQRLIHLAERIDKSLRPRLLERIIQQFGK
ncbi:hypothetical protein [Amycolatopsis thailandensis]|uniref:hypothetical protein n=1 Tax=Amycolatopsis thailandensis TaxID=589330 RepID=UPI0011777047|nr:hypothetical protein [Amycolatopsis thailandensis]